MVQPGDTVFFGGTFYAESEKNRLWIRGSGARNNYIYLKSCTMSNGAEVNDPWFMDWRSSISGWAQGHWHQDGNSNRWYFNYVPGVAYCDPRRMFFTKSNRTELKEGQRRCQRDQVTSEYEWYVDTTSNRIYVYATSNPVEYFSTMMSNSYLDNPHGIRAENQSWIDISGFTAYGSGGSYTMRFTNVDHLRIHNIKWYESNSIAVIQGATAPTHSTGWTADDTAEYVEIYDNIFDSRFTLDNTDPDCMSGSPGGGVSFFDSVRHSKIYRNTFRNFVKTIGLYGAKESNKWLFGVEDNEVFENDISCPDLEYGYTLLMGGNNALYADGFLENNHIYRNYFHDFTNAVSLAGDNVRFYSNIIENVFESSRARKAHTGAGLHLGLGNGGRIYNNTIFYTDEACFRVNDPSRAGAASPRDQEIINNIFCGCTTDSSPDIYKLFPDIQGHYSVIVYDDHDGDDPTKLLFLNNLIYSHGRGEHSPEISYRGNDYTVSAWNGSGTAFDIIMDNLQSDPFFVNATYGNLRLQVYSPAINSGAEVGLTRDFDGTSIPQGIAPDIGAYEFVETKLIRELIRDVINLNLQQGLRISLTANLDTALRKLDDNNKSNDGAAINSLQAFINKVEAQSGKHIPAAEAGAVITAAQDIIMVLGG